MWATAVSVALHPQWVIPSLLFISAYSGIGSLALALHWVVLIVCPPLLAAWAVSLMKGYSLMPSGKSLSKQERIPVYAAGLPGGLLSYLIMIRLGAPCICIALTTAVLSTAIVAAVVNLQWKISVHTASMGIAISLLLNLYGIVVWPAIILLMLVGGARVILHSPTVSQVIVGALVSMIITYITLTSFHC